MKGSLTPFQLNFARANFAFVLALLVECFGINIKQVLLKTQNWSWETICDNLVRNAKDDEEELVDMR